MIVQIRRSSRISMNGRWWLGVKRWPSSAEYRAIWKLPRPYFIGLGPIEVRVWPGQTKMKEAQ